jgi:hypothetical protein
MEFASSQWVTEVWSSPFIHGVQGGVTWGGHAEWLLVGSVVVQAQVAVGVGVGWLLWFMG